MIYSEATKFRNEGNEFHRQHKFFEALIKYNNWLTFIVQQHYWSWSFIRNIRNIRNKFNNIRLAREYEYPDKYPSWENFLLIAFDLCIQGLPVGHHFFFGSSSLVDES